MASFFSRFRQPKPPTGPSAVPVSQPGPPAAPSQPRDPKPASTPVVSPEAAAVFAEATQAYQAKDFERAIALYDRVIALQPDHAEAYYKRANALKDLGRLQEALASYDAAIRYKPDFAYAWCNRGFVQQSLGLPEQALASFDESIRLNPDDIVAHSNRATLLQGMSRWQEALASHDRVVALNPQLFQSWLFRGNILRELKKFDAALSSYQRVIELRPDLAEGHYNHGVVLELLNQPQAALASYDRALEVNPAFEQALFNRAGVLMVLKQPTAALETYDRLIAVNANHADAHLNRAGTRMQLKKSEDALEDFERVATLRPSAQAHLNRGIALQDLGRREEAMQAYEQALGLQPDYAEVYSQRAFTHSTGARYEEALQDYTRAIELKPDFAQAHTNRALVQLVLGDYAQGWLNYEWRWMNKELQKTQRRDFREPLWLGREPIAGKRLLIHSEQGLGDTLQFCRFAKSIADLGATVYLEAQPALVGLLRSLDGVARVIAEDQPLPEFDYHCPTMSLPVALKTTLDTVPGSGYLHAEPAKVAYWRERLGERRRPRIGLAWSGNPTQSNDRNRSFRLAQWIDQLPRELDYFCLQKDIRPEDQPTLAANPGITLLTEAVSNFDDSAALCECLDVVISICTSIVHLSGSLGRPTWVLLPFDADWRWGRGAGPSPWYPSTRIYRQESVGDWDGVFTRVGADLRKMA